MPESDLIQYHKFVSHVIHDLSNSLDAFWFKHGYMNAIVSLPFFSENSLVLAYLVPEEVRVFLISSSFSYPFPFLCFLSPSSAF